MGLEEEKLNKLIDTFLSDSQLIEYLLKDVKKQLKQETAPPTSIVCRVIDQAFEELQLGELISIFLEQYLPSTRFESSQQLLPSIEKTIVPLDSSPIAEKSPQTSIPRPLPKPVEEPNQPRYSETEPQQLHGNGDFNPNKTQYVHLQIDPSVPEEEPSPKSLDDDSLTNINPRSADSPDINFDVAQSHDFENSHSNDSKDENRSYSMSDFETERSPEKTNEQQRLKRRVNFVDGFVTDTYHHREKHSPEDVPDLFYTQDESMKFQYDYDREAQRADQEGIDWIDWMMKRTEEDRLRHEQEDELLQHEYDDYWEENEQYEEDTSQSEELEF